MVSGREPEDGCGIERSAPPERVQRARSQLVCASTSEAAAGWKRGSRPSAVRGGAAQAANVNASAHGAIQRQEVDKAMELSRKKQKRPAAGTLAGGLGQRSL